VFVESFLPQILLRKTSQTPQRNDEGVISIMPNIGLFEIAVFTIVAANLIISLFSDEIKKLGKFCLLLLIVLVIPMALHEILIVKSPDYFFREAKESLKKAQEKLEPDDPAMDE